MAPSLIKSVYWIRLIIIWRKERRNVTSRYYGCKISGSQQSLLTETSNDGRKVWASVLFPSATMHRKVTQCIFSFFFLPYLQDRGLLRSRNIATMATWRNALSPLWRSKRVVSAEVDDTLRGAVLFMPIKRLIRGKGDFFIFVFLNMITNPIISQMLNFCDVALLFSVVLKKV